MKDKRGRQLVKEEVNMYRRAENFEELSNRSVPHNRPDVEGANENLPIECNTPTHEEIRKAIKHLRNGKAAGPDGILVEALKADTETMVDMLYPLFKKIWKEEDVPADWKATYLMKISKRRP